MPARDARKDDDIAMDWYYACFEKIKGQLFRFDTRIYLGPDEPEPAQGVCVAAIIGKNPGSARPRELNQWGPLHLTGDKLLPSVRNRFIDAYKAAKKAPPRNAYVRVWNLFYMCNVSPTAAVQQMQRFPSPPTCPTEAMLPTVVWFAWGGNVPRLNGFKTRFLALRCENQFFYDHRMGVVVPRAPLVSDLAKHTQGMPTRPVVDHLKRLL